MTEKTLTTENIKPALDALRGELAPWPVVAKKQDRLNTAQLNAANSGITSSLVAQIIANTAAIRALESAITGTGLRALVVSSLPTVGTLGILYIVPVTTYDPETDADVVNYSNEYIWIVAPDAPVTEGYYEQVGQTGIVINNGQLTITVNGTSVGTFTANQSGDTTAAITVPTNADYVDRTTDQTIAGVKTFSSTIDGTASKAIADEDGISIKTGYGKLAVNQTWSGSNTFTGNAFLESAFVRNTAIIPGSTPSSAQTITQTYAANSNATLGYSRVVLYDTGVTTFEVATRNKFSNGALDPSGTYIESKMTVGLDNTGLGYFAFTGKVKNNLTPFTNSTYSLGSSSYQWSSVYAQTYYYNGTAWGLDKSNTWTGNNEYKYLIGLSGGEIWFKHPNIEDITTNPNTDISKSILQIWNKGVTQYSGGITDSLLTDGTHRFTILCFGFPLNNYGGYYPHSFSFEAKRDGTASFSPSYTNASLGTPTNKWKTLNGVNPGALSLPNSPGGSGTVNINYIDLSGDITIRDASSANFYTAICDGWIAINSYATWIQIADDTTLVCVTGAIGADGFGQCYLPVRKNDSLRIVINQTNTNFQSFKLIPCQGNV